MDTGRIAFEELPQIIRDEIATLALDFTHLPEPRRWRAIEYHLSDESWLYIDELIALRRAAPDLPRSAYTSE